MATTSKNTSSIESNFIHDIHISGTITKCSGKMLFDLCVDFFTVRFLLLLLFFVSLFLVNEWSSFFFWNWRYSTSLTMVHATHSILDGFITSSTYMSSNNNNNINGIERNRIPWPNTFSSYWQTIKWNGLPFAAKMRKLGE